MYVLEGLFLIEGRFLSCFCALHRVLHFFSALHVFPFFPHSGSHNAHLVFLSARLAFHISANTLCQINLSDTVFCTGSCLTFRKALCRFSYILMTALSIPQLYTPFCLPRLVFTFVTATQLAAFKHLAPLFSFLDCYTLSSVSAACKSLTLPIYSNKVSGIREGGL